MNKTVEKQETVKETKKEVKKKKVEGKIDKKEISVKKEGKRAEDVYAMANVKDLKISTKQAVEICRFIRNKKLQKAKDILNNVMQKKIIVPYKRYKHVPHKSGKIAAGRYPIKASRYILRILEGAEANAEHKGLNPDDLKIISIIPNRGTKQWHYGRKRRRIMKRTNISVVLKEGK